MERFSRSELLFGKENMDKLKFAHVLVVGIGGVGGYVCEVLARGGVGNLSIVDFDNVSESNIKYHTDIDMYDAETSRNFKKKGFGKTKSYGVSKRRF